MKLIKSADEIEEHTYSNVRVSLSKNHSHLEQIVNEMKEVNKDWDTGYYFCEEGTLPGKLNPELKDPVFIWNFFYPGDVDQIMYDKMTDMLNKYGDTTHTIPDKRAPIQCPFGEPK